MQASRRSSSSLLHALLVGAAIAAVASAVAVVTVSVAGAVAASLLLVLAITVAGATVGLAAAFAAAIICCLAYTLLLTEPLLTFQLTGRDMIPLVVFTIVALLVGLLAGRARHLAAVAQRRNRELGTLLEVSHELQSAQRPGRAIAPLLSAATSTLGIRIAIFRLVQGRLIPVSDDVDGEEQQAAASALGGEVAPSGDDSLLAFPLKAKLGVRGVLTARFGGGNVERRESVALVAGLANILAIALERGDLAEEAVERAAKARSEELKTALLSSVSHDFRTPLATINASATSLLTMEDKFDPEIRRSLLQSIVEECERLNRYTANLLEFGKLTAGVPSNAAVIDAGDPVRAAMRRVKSKLGARTLVRDISECVLQVRADPTLFELVLINVLDNAILYGPDDGRIEVSMRGAGEMLTIEVADDGCGIPAADLPRIFERFHRVQRSGSNPRGSGLGLPIAKAFVRAFGGDISVTTPGLEGRGTRVSIHLPLVEAAR